MANLKVFAGFSINPEMVVQFSAQPGFEKTPGFSHRMGFSGSSANIANALGLWGVNTLLLGLVGVEKTDADDYLDIALRKSVVPFQRIPLLTETSFAEVRANELVGNDLVSFKGKIVKNQVPLALERIVQTMNGDDGFRVASGVTEDQSELFKIFWGDFVGFRTFCPHGSLVKNKEVFLSLCSLADLVIMNSREFGDSGLRVAEIHKKGVRLVIITNGDEGGIFSLDGKEYSYSAEKVKGTFGTGAGDWFHAMVVCFLRDHSLNFDSASFGDVKESIHFASTVVALKVTYPGGAQGPSRSDLFF